MVLCLVFLPFVWWAAAITACAIAPDKNFIQILETLSEKLEQPFFITYTPYTFKCILIFTAAYFLGIGIYESQKRNYRRGVEHGSAKWGNVSEICRRYCEKQYTQNLLLTQHFRMGLDGYKHKRNLNVLVVGGSGAGKSRTYAIPNIMQCNCSMVITDPKAELLRKTGGVLERNGYEVRVFDLINPETSWCYNPFAYVWDDKDVLKLINNLIRNTTPKGAQSSDPFWEKSETALLQALMLYLLHEAPPEEQNFPMIMEMLGSAQVKEDDEDYQSPLDILFERLEMRDPESIAVKQYAIYKQAAGECVLYLKENEGYNRKVLITRSAGMRILEQNRISGSIEFTGVLIIEGMKMNETFKAMEVPSHDAWEPGRCRGEEKYYTNVLNDLKKYIKACVKDSFGKISSDSIDAIGASDFLPDKIEDGKQPKLQKNDLSTRIKKMLGKSIEPTKKKTKAIDLSEADLKDDNSGGSGPGEGPGPNPGLGPHPHPGPGPGPEPGPEPGPHPGPNPGPDSKKTGEKIKYKQIPVKKRLVCTDLNEGKYVLSFLSPSKATKAKLEFSLSGEQSDFDLPIHDAKIISGASGTTVERTMGNKIYLNNLVKGDSVKVEIKVDFDSYCMMEVDYYANKK